MKIEIRYLDCLRCGHKWIPRTSDVRICPKCKNPYFDKPYTKIKPIEEKQKTA